MVSRKGKILLRAEGAAASSAQVVLSYNTELDHGSSAVSSYGLSRLICPTQSVPSLYWGA